MAVSQTDTPASRFRCAAEKTIGFFDIFEEFADNLELDGHPETISQARINAFRNEVIRVRHQWESYRDELLTVSDQLAAGSPAERVQPPSEEEIKAFVGCAAVVGCATLVVGVLLGSWISG